MGGGACRCRKKGVLEEGLCTFLLVSLPCSSHSALGRSFFTVAGACASREIFVRGITGERGWCVTGGKAFVGDFGCLKGAEKAK